MRDTIPESRQGGAYQAGTGAHPEFFIGVGEADPEAVYNLFDFNIVINIMS
jgi:hypothetical protein